MSIDQQTRAQVLDDELEMLWERLRRIAEGGSLYRDMDRWADSCLALGMTEGDRWFIRSIRRGVLESIDSIEAAIIERLAIARAHEEVTH
ncbi:MAG: hypothetical protein LBH13_06455 [Cellulomonadaceae bacterium]|jgi:hypothetical protein|nr:hypothetical protein [Cellulomonadaceae bacterium]